MIDTLLSTLNGISLLEGISVLFGLIYVVLAAKEKIACWPAALINTATATVLFWQFDLLMESALNVFYFFIAIYGWYSWSYGGKLKLGEISHKSSNTRLEISTWTTDKHLLTIASVIALSLLSGWVLSRHSAASFPYLDSFTTWSAIVTTWMVTRKILENWLYWIAIDLIGIWLMWQKELYLYAFLFLLYTVIAVYGFMQWRRNYARITANTA